MTRTANLQKGLTVKQAAEMMNVSERSVYMAMTVNQSRPDLAADVEAGRLSLNKAYNLATGRQKRERYDVLCSAWEAASSDDRRRFMSKIGVEFIAENGDGPRC